MAQVHGDELTSKIQQSRKSLRAMMVCGLANSFCCFVYSNLLMGASQDCIHVQVVELLLLDTPPNMVRAAWLSL